jgi:two-component system, sensor histidine kinase PdtaS
VKKYTKWQVASVNMAKANLFYNLGNCEKSSEAAALALKMYEAIPDTAGMVNASNKLGYLLSEINRLDEALKHLKTSVKLVKNTNLKRDEANAYTNTALVYEKLPQLDSALRYYRKAYKIGETLDDDYSKFNNRYNMSNIHQLRKNMDSAVYYGQKTLDISRSLAIPSLSIAAKRLLTDIELDQGNIYKALEIVESISETEMKSLGIRDQVENFTVKTKAYKQKGDFKKAFESLEYLKKLNDSLVGENTRNKINELEIAYQTEKKEQQIALLDLENQNAQLQISRKNRTILIVSIALFLIVILSIILYAIIQKYLKQKKVLAKALDEKNLLLKEIHHRVKNNLQLVSSLLTLQGQSITDDVALMAINEGKSRVRSMALIHQDLYQTDNITAVSAQTYLLKLCKELFDTYNIKKDQVKLEARIEPLNIDVDTLIPIGLIINELITNSLKYAFTEGENGLIQIELKEDNQLLKLTVRDNGKGYDLESVSKTSFGNRLIKSLIQQLDGNMTTAIDNGTVVSMEFRDYKISRASKN